MSPWSWLIIISAFIWAVIIFLFKHSYEDWHWNSNGEKVYKADDKLVAPLWIYLLVILSLFIPVVNVIGAVITLINFFPAYADGTFYFHMELPESLKFLTEEF